MNSIVTSLFEFFAQGGRQYRAPLYQRQYVWTKERHWEPLWSEIKERADQFLKPQPTAQGVKAPNMHFLGAIVTMLGDGMEHGAVKYDIVDGQQRLITFQILFAAFRDYLNTLNILNDKNINSIQGQYDERTKNASQVKDTDEYKVWPTNKDQGVFMQVISAGGIDNLPVSDKPLVSAYKYFYKQIMQYCQSENSPDLADKDNVFALDNTLRRIFALVDIVLGENDDPQIIFESLNGRGQPLLPSDLIRNFVLMRAQLHCEESIEYLYEKYWERYDENDNSKRHQAEEEVGKDDFGGGFWMKEDRHGRMTKRRIDLFMLHYLQSRQPNEKVSIDHLYKSFQEWWKGNKCDSNIDQQLLAMNEYSDMYAGVVNPMGQSPLAMFAAKLKILDTTTIYPVLLFLLVDQKDNIDDIDLEGIYKDLESFLVRRTICGRTQQGYTNLFLGLLRELHEVSKKSKIDRKFVQKFLLRGTGVNTVWPNDRDFKRAWLNKENYESRYSSRVRMILTEINNNMYKRAPDSQMVDTLTVEHILPEAWKDNDWPLLGDEWYERNRIEDEERETTRGRLLNTFGNLTLLTGELNSLASNKSFRMKKSEIAGHTQIPLNNVFSNEEEWNEEKIISRGEMLFKHALEIWQRPEDSKD